jgi:hypothetical protein
MNNSDKDPLEVLRNFNEWRRGAEVAPPPQREIGLAIHAVIDELETLRKMVNIPAKSERAMISSKPMLLTIRVHPRLKKDGSLGKERTDIDTIKAVCDALNDVAWHDDRRVVRVVVEVSDPLPDGGLMVLWSEA